MQAGPVESGVQAGPVESGVDPLEGQLAVCCHNVHVITPKSKMPMIPFGY